MTDTANDHAPILTAPGEAARLRALGFNVIPVRAGSKMAPARRTGDILKWREEKCGETVRSDDSIVMLHGRAGGTWALDLDYPTILEDLLVRHGGGACRCVVKTPQRGHHIIFKRDESDPPPGDCTYADKKGRKLDVKSRGYTLLPPSVHPEKSLGRYEYLSDTDSPPAPMKWRDALSLMHTAGFTGVHGRGQAAGEAYGDAAKIVLANGVYDLGRDEFTKCSPEPADAVRLPITYDPSAEAYVFDRALEDWFGEGGTEYMDAVWEMFATCMLKKSMPQKAYIHYGSGSNGKSTCLAVLRQMLGPQNTASVGMRELGDRFGSDTIRGKLANISDGDHMRGHVRLGLVEAVLGGDAVMCGRKYGKPFAYRPFCTMVFAFNEPPPDTGLPADRVRIIPWSNRFEHGDEAIARLPYDESERSGLFNRLVPVMRRLLSEADARSVGTA